MSTHLFHKCTIVFAVLVSSCTTVSGTPFVYGGGSGFPPNQGQVYKLLMQRGCGNVFSSNSSSGDIGNCISFDPTDSLSTFRGTIGINSHIESAGIKKRVAGDGSYSSSFKVDAMVHSTYEVKVDNEKVYSLNVTMADGTQKSLLDAKTIKKGAENEIKTKIREYLFSVVTDPKLTAKIDGFASNFAETAMRVLGMQSADRLRSRRVGSESIELTEYFSGCGYLISATLLKAADQPILNLVVCDNNRYLYAKEGISNEEIQDNLNEVLLFIRENKSIALPDLKMDAAKTKFEGIFDPANGNTEESVAISDDAQASIAALVQTSASGKIIVSPEKKEEKAIAAKKTEQPAEEKKERFVIKQPAKLEAGADAFELKAVTTPDDAANSFSLELRDYKDYSKAYTLGRDISEAEFLQTVYNDPKVKTMTLTQANKNALSDYYGQLKTSLALNDEKQKLRSEAAEKKALVKVAEEETEKYKKEFLSRLDNIAGETDHSATLTVRDEIPIRAAETDDGKLLADVKTAVIKVDSVILRINNNVTQIDINGKIDGQEMHSLINASYGLNLRGLQNSSPRLKFFVENRGWFVLCYSQVFYVHSPSDGALSFNLRDGEYRFIVNAPKATKTIELYQKSLLDFISASAFIDLWSFNQKSTNKNLLTELYLNFPLNTWKTMSGPWSWWRYVNMTVSAGANLFKEAVQFNTVRAPFLVKRDSSQVSAGPPATYKYHDSVMSNRHYFNSFDLLKYASFTARPMLNIVSWDYKPGNTVIDLNIGGLLMASNGKFNDPAKGVDSVYSQSVFSSGVLAEVRARVFPKPKFGFDLRLDYCFGIRSMSPTIRGVTGNYELETLVKANMLDTNYSDFWNAEANIVFNPRKEASKTDRGGVYLKINAARSIHHADGFISFMVGYSTDIKNFFR